MSLQASLGAVLVLFICAYAHGHALKETTATITVRSGQIDVLVNTDFSHWLEQLHSNESWLLGDTELVLKNTHSENEKVTLLKDMVLSSSKVMVNNTQLSCKLIQFPSKLDVLHKAHHSRGYFRLSCLSQRKKLESVSLSLPKSLGRVYVSLVQPKQQLIDAGQRAAFTLK
ncbi:hypothetical protein [Pseudoalteromonas luteoviolacea]|uniref:hypothetical protein n=1 Tax=Pseudoalteromonas luteoviolacea TaxID=43657 RepID=UPI001B35BAB6|nr:hypothetical protein [Pseudoalteromonas luteoviolacea]MBQ4835511.1 hypothetical protein [Pseudoalteromonas luteoviolacea]